VTAKEGNQKAPKSPGTGLMIFDPEHPPFETQCVCDYLRELEEEAQEREARSDDHGISMERD